MKKILFFTFLLSFLFLNPSYSAVKTWIGGNSNWSNGANWSPAGAPIGTDDVVINSVCTITMDVNPSINSLLISATGTVQLSASAVRTITLSSTSAVTQGLQINAGSTLQLTQSAASAFKLSLTGNIGVTGMIDGTLRFSGSIAGATAALEVYTGPLANAILKVNPAGIIQYDVNSGNTVGGTTSNLLMEAGSQYIILKDGGTVPTANYKDGSYIRIQGVVATVPVFSSSALYNGVVEWNSSSQTATGTAGSLSLSSSYTFDSLVIKNSGTGTVRLATEMSTSPSINFIRVEGGKFEFASPRAANRSISINNLEVAGGACYLDATDASDLGLVYSVTVTVNNNVSVNSGTLFMSNRPNGTSSTYGTGNIRCKKDFLQTGGLITESSPIPPISDASIIYMDGTVAQNLKLTNWTNEVRLSIDNATNGVTLQSDIVCPEFLLMNTTSAYAVLGNYNFSVTYQKTVISTAGTLPARFITNGSGKVKMLSMPASSSFKFPVAYNNTTFNPVTVAPQAGAISNDYYVRVENGNNPAGIFNTGKTINRTWIINSASLINSNSVNLSFQYAAADANVSCAPAAAMELGHFVSGAWSLDPGGTVLPTGSDPYVAGTYAPNTFDSSFVLGNQFAILALHTEAFLTIKKENELARLAWVINSPGNVKDIIVERSADGIHFTSLHSVSFSNDAYVDASMLQGLNYYRLKITNLNGSIAYSNTVVVINKTEKLTILSIRSNSGGTEFTVIADQPGQAVISIVDAEGRLIYQRVTMLQKGSNQIHLNSNFVSGSYRLNCRSGNSVITKGFVRL